MKDLEEYFTPEMWPWITGMPNEMVGQMQDNIAKLMEYLPETPEALEAARMVADFNFRIIRSFAQQLGDEDSGLDANDSSWRILASAAVQNVALMLRIDQVLRP